MLCYVCTPKRVVHLHHTIEQEVPTLHPCVSLNKSVSILWLLEIYLDKPRVKFVTLEMRKNQTSCDWLCFLRTLGSS